MSYDQIDPRMLAAALGGRNGRSNSIDFGGGSILTAPPEQRMRQLMAQQLLGADPASAKTKAEGVARLGQQLLGAYMAREGIDAEKARDQSDSALVAAALRSQDRSPTTLENGETITWNKPSPSTMATILGQGSPRLQEAGLAMSLTQQQREADRAAKTVSTLTPDEVKTLGLPVGSIAQRDAYGKLDVVNKPDVFMPFDGGATPSTPSPKASAGGTQTAPRLTAAPLRTDIERAALSNGVDPSLALTAAHIESGMGTAPDRRGSQYIGPFQMGEARWADMGGTAENRSDKGAQVDLGVKALKATQGELAQKIGRQPEPWEVYLAHQQGVTGAAALLSSPDASAVEALRPYYRDGKNLSAVIDNLPGSAEADANISAKDFAGLWRDRYNRIAQSYPQRPAQVADAGAVATVATDAPPEQPPQRATAPQVGMYKGQVVQRDPTTGAVLPYQKPPEPTTLEKLMAARDRLPQGHPDRAALEQAIANDTAKKEGESRDFTQAKALRTEFNGFAKQFEGAQEGFLKVQQAAKTDSAAGDLALIFGYMKTLDPTSTVREGEFATAQNAGGIPDRVVNAYNRAINGERLNPDQRAMFVGAAQDQFAVNRASYDRRVAEYSRLAKSFGIDPAQVITDFSLPDMGRSAQPDPNGWQAMDIPKDLQPPAGAASSGIPTPPSGFQIVR